MQQPRIEDYAVIGDCRTCAHVGRDGSIDWLCLPRFDSPACFAKLLGTPEHGFWKLAPADAAASMSRAYRDGSLILDVTYRTSKGEVRVVDFMPIGSDNPQVVRLVQGVKGEVAMRMTIAIRFDYGMTVPWVMRTGWSDIRAVGGPNKLVLRAGAATHGQGHMTVSEFTVGEGETVPFVLAWGPSHVMDANPVDPHLALAATERFWQAWSCRCQYDGPYRPQVERSLLALKALTYEPTGGIVAAPTTSLPEYIGSVRNWDYRFCWLRDSAFTLTALLDAGYVDEARAWRDWLARAVAGNPEQTQILYGVAGERHMPELELGWLPGYEGSKPVRIGNAAGSQFQLDVYGEVADAMFQSGVRALPPTPGGWAHTLVLMDYLAKVWVEPDEGIWEVRGGRQHFVHSKVMAWVAFDRVIRRAELGHHEAPLDQWRALRAAIHKDVCEKGFDPKLGSFVQAYGSKALDASLLRIPIVGFLPPQDERVRGTLAAIEKGLMVDGLMLRYRTEETADGLPAGEGAFLPCTFWYADNLILQGRMDEARKLFERLAALANDVGLLSEEYDARDKRMLGNFPQAFSHVALVNTAIRLMRAMKGEAAPEEAPQSGMKGNGPGKRST
jgi:GH15 family glucan-1,4-alpha-glucosidase